MTTEQRKEEEIWKDVVGYEGLYQVSSIGRVKSLKGNAKILKLTKAGGGYVKRYLRVQLTKEGAPKSYFVHTLMGNAFFGVDKTKVTDHINNISADNRIENLQRITHRENISKERTGTSQYTGVSWKAKLGKWQAKITLDGKTIWLGCHVNEIDASNAYQSALSHYQHLKEKQ